jgi:hypothetical protein
MQYQRSASGPRKHEFQDVANCKRRRAFNGKRISADVFEPSLAASGRFRADQALDESNALTVSPFSACSSWRH